MEDLIMKKLIMFLMVLTISTPALADDLNPPDWALGPGTIYGIWEFPSADSGQEGDYPEVGEMVPHATNPDPEELTSTSDPDEVAHQYMEVSYASGASWLEDHEGREGVVSHGMSFWANNFFPGEGTKLIRLQVTWTGSEISIFYVGAGGGTYTGPAEWYPLSEDVHIETVDLGDGWSHSTYEFLIEGNPYWEWLYVGAIESGTIYFDQIVIDTICYPGAAPPPGPGRGEAAKPPVTVDSNDLPVYEPEDTGGPPRLGPTDGQLLVSLTWQPGEPTYPNFTATVVIDPNEGPGEHEDFIFPDSTDTNNGTITLTFTQANWSDPQPVNVQAVADFDKEGNESYPIELTVTIDIADPNFGNPTPVVVNSSVGVVDNDIPFVVVVPPGGELEDVLTENDPCVPKCVDITLSHLPTDDVYVLVTRWSWDDILLESMSVMDPPLDVIGDPNKLKFTPDNYNTPQQICLEARDDDVLVEAWYEWIEGEINLTPYSEDERYRVSWLTADGTDPPEDPCDPGTLLPSGGEAEEVAIIFNVQDNECGAVGYDPVDYNEDCRVGLADFAHYLAQWLICTDPYDDAGDCIKLWELE